MPIAEPAPGHPGLRRSSCGTLCSSTRSAGRSAPRSQTGVTAHEVGSEGEGTSWIWSRV